MITRREFTLFALMAGGSLILPKKAFAEAKVGKVLEEFDYAGELEEGTTAIPLGRFAQSILYSINPALLNPEVSLVHKRNEADLIRQLKGAKVTVDSVQRVEEIAEASAPIVEIGEADRLSEDIHTRLMESTGKPAIFLSGDSNDLAATYRDLGYLFKIDKCEQMAAYIDNVFALVNSRREEMFSSSPKRVFFGSGSAGLGCDTYRYLQKNVFDKLNCLCINNDIVFVSEDSGTRIVDLDELEAANIDHVFFQAQNQDDFVAHSGAAWYLWRNLSVVRRGDAIFVPSTDFSWIGTPLVSQCLGILWMAHALYPEFFSMSDLDACISQFFELFVHCAAPAEVSDSGFLYAKAAITNG